MDEVRTLKKEGKWSRESFRERLKEKCVSRVRQERGNLLARLRVAGSCGIQADVVEGIAKGLVHGEFAESRDSLMTCVEGVASMRPPIGEDEEVRCFFLHVYLSLFHVQSARDGERNHGVVFLSSSHLITYACTRIKSVKKLG